MGVSAGILFELDREGRVHRDVLAQLERNDRAEAVRGALAELGHAARLVAAIGTRESAATVERLAGDVEGGLGELAPGEPALAEVEQLSRIAVLNARSVQGARAARGAAAAEEAAREAERNGQLAATLLERHVNEHAARINRVTASQLRIGAVLRTAVVTALVGAIGLMAALFALYRAARRRERAALQRVEHLAHYDALTGLPNRASLALRLDQEVARARRGGTELVAVMFDLDGFKTVNDTWGHAAGDQALVMAAERARGAMRTSDVVGRLGGDEFLALLPETSQAGAVSVAEKLREALARPYRLDDGEAFMSVSLGLAVFPRHGADAAALLRAADEALYAAKRHGKDRFEVAGA